MGCKVMYYLRLSLLGVLVAGLIAGCQGGRLQGTADESAMVTGSALMIDGGWSAGK